VELCIEEGSFPHDFDCGGFALGDFALSWLAGQDVATVYRVMEHTLHLKRVGRKFDAGTYPPNSAVIATFAMGQSMRHFALGYLDERCALEAEWYSKFGGGFPVLVHSLDEIKHGGYGVLDEYLSACLPTAAHRDGEATTSTRDPPLGMGCLRSADWLRALPSVTLKFMSLFDDPRIAVWQREQARIDANHPPPNADNPPKRHHYVPEMYLARFATRPSNKRTPRVRRIEMASGPSSAITIGVRDAAVETDFYTVETDDPRRAHEAEHMIGVFERAAGYAFANLDRDRNHFPDDIDRENLSLFMALQFARGHDTADFQSRSYTQTSRMIMRIAAATPDIVRNFLASEGKDTSDEAMAQTSAAFTQAAKTLSATPHKNETVSAVLNGAVEFMSCFFHRRWIIARSPAPLLTSDRPIVLLKRHAPAESWRGVGVGTADQIVFALDRHRVLIMSQPDAARVEGVMDVSAGFVERLNVAIANRARRWLFHHPDDKPLDGIPFNPNPKSRSSAPTR
jgi:hypothetical protein